MPFIKLTRLEQKRFGAVVICIFCAVGAWLFMALNKKYPYTVQTEILYKDEPQGKAFKALQPDTVDLKVEGTGWQLLFARLRISPPSINVSLQKLNSRSYVVFSEQLDQINRQLETSQQVILKLTNIKENVETRVNVLRNAISNVSIYPNNVGVKLTVDEFTEKTIEVPLTILNNKEYYDVKLYPKKVKITLLVALSNYAKADNNLKAVVDLNEWKVLKHNRLGVKVTTLPEFSKLVSISPSNVDFIIEK
jgi:hypothetical protein